MSAAVLDTMLLVLESCPGGEKEMEETRRKLHDLGIDVSRILLPSGGVDLSKWAVIACDQHTSNPSYWEDVERTVGDAPSTLRLILPECYLGAGDEDARISAIHEAMRRYRKTGVLEEVRDSLVLVRRRTAGGDLRLGIVVAVDLEQYSFDPAEPKRIQATEATILDRIPPRIRVREDAEVETPHVLVLIDDPDCTVIEPIWTRVQAQGASPRYSTDLMAGGGHIDGWTIPLSELGAMADALGRLDSGERKRERYGTDEAMLFAVGDGNHSLATAREWWYRVRESLSAEARRTHPARWALVEIVNLHDPGLSIHGIHRVVQAPVSEVKAALSEAVATGAMVEAGARSGESTSEPTSPQPGTFVVCGEGRTWIGTPQPKEDETVADIVDGALAGWIESGRIDYVHGDAEASALATQPGVTSVLLPALSRDDLFRLVLARGALPRKAFSLGNAADKRYYVEARAITAASQ
jgi:hypothetical protein